MAARRSWLVAWLLLSALLSGCGEGTQSKGSKETKEGLPEAEVEACQALKTSYHDWEAVELRNGLVKLQVVPRLGGRAMGLTFNERELLYANPKLLGQYPGVSAGSREPWVPATAGAERPATEPAPTGQPVDEGAPTTPQPPGVATPEEPEEVPGGGLRHRNGPLHPVASAGDAATPATPATPPTATESGAATSEGSTSIGENGAAADLPTAGEAPTTPAPAEPEALRYVPSPTTEHYQNYGGQSALPAPQSHWAAAWPPPVALDWGTYAATVERTDGDFAELKLVSPNDEGLGVELTRTVTLFRASTAWRVEHTLRNTGQRARTWAVADHSQHPGALTPGETFTKDVQVFLPLAAESRHHLGFAALLGLQTSPQYVPESGQMRVEYLGEEGLFGTDDRRGWVVWGDRRHDTVLAKLTHLPAQGTWPEGGLSTLVYTSPAKTESYVQLTLRSPLAVIEPNATLGLTTWYGAATCPLPIVNATRAGVVNTPLSAERLGDTVQLQGVFGVFYSGFAQVAFYDQAGAMLARTSPVTVSPLQPYRLDTVAVLPDGAVRAALLITNHRRVDIAELADAAVQDLVPDKAEELAVQPEPVIPATTPSVPAVSLDGSSPTTLPARSDMPTAAEPATATGTGLESANPSGQEPSVQPAP